MHVVTDAVPTDGIAGRTVQNHKEHHVVPGWIVLRALLVLVLMALSNGTAAVDINHADASALQQGLTMVGPSRAAAIVEHRRQHGPFRRAEDLARVKGIGKAIVERNRQRITLGRMTRSNEPVPGPVPVRPVPRR